ncbi:hypothetical protein AB0I77_43350 [Streptomyces sp. NPDC050619]|uniref:hypothetical protein n=1 Tax=Streptomyces sp. NPDC050619 TaxID=3157214 RepID=UPI003445E623
MALVLVVPDLQQYVVVGTAGAGEVDGQSSAGEPVAGQHGSDVCRIRPDEADEVFGGQSALALDLFHDQADMGRSQE